MAFAKEKLIQAAIQGCIVLIRQLQKITSIAQALEQKFDVKVPTAQLDAGQKETRLAMKTIVRSLEGIIGHPKVAEILGSDQPSHSQDILLKD